MLFCGVEISFFGRCSLQHLQLQRHAGQCEATACRQASGGVRQQLRQLLQRRRARETLTVGPAAVERLHFLQFQFIKPVIIFHNLGLGKCHNDSTVPHTRMFAATITAHRGDICCRA